MLGRGRIFWELKGVCFAAALLIVGSLAGCMSEHSERVGDVDPAGWDARDTVFVALDNHDTLANRDIILFFRYNDNFQNSELPLRIGVTAPDSLRFEENYTALIARPKNSFTGYREYEATYRTDNIFYKQGTYVFSFVTGQDDVKGLSAIGVKITEKK